MELLYDGTLNRLTIESVKTSMATNSCPVEVDVETNKFWEAFQPFSKTIMRQIREVLEYGDGSPRIYNGPSYITSHKNDEETVYFIFFRFESDRDAFKEHFKHLKMNCSPFKTVIK